MSTPASSSQESADSSPIQPANGKLGIMIPGMGSVATTLGAGVEAVRKGIAKPIGSLTQMGTIRLGEHTDARTPLIRDFVPLAKLDNLCFTGWDIFPENMFEAARTAHVLDRDQLETVRPFLEGIRPMPAVFDQYYVKRLQGSHVKKGKNKRDLAEQLRADIQAYKRVTARQVMIWCGSRERFFTPA